MDQYNGKLVQEQRDVVRCSISGSAGLVDDYLASCFSPPVLDPPVSCLRRVLFSLCAGKVGVGNFLAGISRDLPQLVDVRREQIKETRRLQLDLFYIRGFAPPLPHLSSFSLNRQYDHFSGRLGVTGFIGLLSGFPHVFQVLYISLLHTSRHHKPRRLYTSVFERKSCKRS